MAGPLPCSPVGVRVVDEGHRSGAAHDRDRRSVRDQAQGPVELHGLQYLAIPVELAPGKTMPAPYLFQNAAGPDFGEGVAAFAEKRKPVWPNG